MVFIRGICVVALVFAVGACSTWSTSSVKRMPGAPATSRTAPSNIVVTQGGITDREYRVLAEIKARVRKTTIFNADPTREMVNEELRKEASKLGADAVIEVVYGSVNVDPMSWGGLTGRGKAVSYVN